MGSACSSNSCCESKYDYGNLSPAEQQSRDAERLLEEEKIRDALSLKCLTLGAGESGKSTFIKQLLFVYQKKQAVDDKQSYILVLHNNAMTAIQTLIQETETLKQPLTPEEEKIAELCKAYDSSSFMSTELAEGVHKLWTNSEAIKAVWARKAEFWHLETTDFYLDNVLRFASASFTPTEEDIVLARKRTTGVVVSDFQYKEIKWSVVDVGGQRSERRKWINCFDNVHAIFWVSNLAGYGKVLFEDRNVNRMHEDLNLFEETLKHKAFQNAQVYLFMNKKDLFEGMIKKLPLSTCFPHYVGSTDVKEAMNFIAEEFQKRLPEGRSRIKVMPIAARVKKDVQYAFQEASDDLLVSRDKIIKDALAQRDKFNKQKEKEMQKRKEAKSAKVTPEPAPVAAAPVAAEAGAAVSSSSPPAGDQSQQTKVSVTVSPAVQTP